MKDRILKSLGYTLTRYGPVEYIRGLRECKSGSNFLIIVSFNKPEQSQSSVLHPHPPEKLHKTATRVGKEWVILIFLVSFFSSRKVKRDNPAAFYIFSYPE